VQVNTSPDGCTFVIGNFAEETEVDEEYLFDELEHVILTGRLPDDWSTTSRLRGVIEQIIESEFGCNALLVVRDKHTYVQYHVQDQDEADDIIAICKDLDPQVSQKTHEERKCTEEQDDACEVCAAMPLAMQRSSHWIQPVVMH
jgi:hypothetical protein